MMGADAPIPPIAMNGRRPRGGTPAAASIAGFQARSYLTCHIVCVLRLALMRYTAQYNTVACEMILAGSSPCPFLWSVWYEGPCLFRIPIARCNRAAALIFRTGKPWIPDNRRLKWASPQTMVSKNDETVSKVPEI